MLPTNQHHTFTVIGSITGDIASSSLYHSLLYLACESDFVIFDVTDPVHPAELNRIPFQHAIEHIVVAGSFAYVVDFDDQNEQGHLHVIDITNPHASQLVKSLGMTMNPSGLAIHDTYVLIADSWYGFHICDVASPHSMRKVGSFPITAGGWSIGMMQDLACVAAGDDGLYVVDLTNPSQPMPIGRCTLPGHVHHIAFAAKHAYLAGGPAGLHIIDLSTPTQPHLLGNYRDDTVTSGHVTVVNNRAFLAGSPGRIVDCTNPVKPELIGTYRWGWIDHVCEDLKRATLIHPEGIDLITFNHMA